VTAGRTGEVRERTVFLGSGPFGLEALRRLAGHSDVEVVGIVTAPDQSAGGHPRRTPTPIAALGRELGVSRILTPDRLRSPEAIASVIALRPDLAVLADYGQLVPAELLAIRDGALNLHPSLLPRHRGATPIPAAILAGDRETGVTLMRMDDGLDTGPIVAQRRIELTGRETAPELEERLAEVAAELVEGSVGRWIAGERSTRPQADADATLTRPLRREHGRLDPTRSAKELERQVRAYQPWPGSFVELDRGRLTVWAAGTGPATSRAPGILGPDGISTHDSELLLTEVQPAGGRRMPWEAFLRGRPDIVGRAILRAP
jgi:methionyl-tRNA formyltransferase